LEGSTLRDERKIVALLMVGASLTGGQIAWAGQDVHDTGDKAGFDETIEEITVTATRTERPVFTTPSAVSVIDASDFESFQPLNYRDVFEGVPGVAIQGGARRIAEEPSIRGFSDQQLVVRLDGARQNFDLAHRGRFFVDQDLVRRIEVLRGSASALYGSGAIGGVISLETKGARDLLEDGETFGTRAKTAYQSNGDEFLASAGLYGQTGKVDGFANLVYREIFNDLEDGSGQAILDSRDRVLNGLVKFGFEPNEDTRFEVVADVLDNDGANPTAADSISSPSTVVGRSTTEYNIRTNFTHRDANRSWVDFRATAFYTNLDIVEDRIIDRRLDKSGFESFGIDFYNTSRFSAGEAATVSLTYGFEYFKDRQSGTRNGSPRLQFPNANRRFSGGYAQAEIDLFGDRLSIVPGIRFDSFKLRPRGNFPGRQEHDTSPRLAVGARPADWLYLWVSYAEAFRAPSLNELYNDGVHFAVPNGLGPGTLVINEFAPTPLLNSEQAKTVEFGARVKKKNSLVAGDNLTLSGNYFSSDIGNFIDTVVEFIDPARTPVFTPPDGPLTFFGSTTNQNIRMRIEGIEGEIRYESSRLSATVSGFAVDGTNRNLGRGLGAIPPNSVTFGLTGKMLAGGLNIGGRLTLAASRRDVPERSVTTDSYEKMDIFARWTPLDGPLSGAVITLGIDNLFDLTYSIHPTVIRQPSRSFRLSLSKKFGG